MLVKLGAKSPVTDRYYFTLWFDNAAGYSDKYLQEVKTALTKSQFPQISFDNVHVKSGGCLFGLFGSEEFDAVHMESAEEELSDFGCLYKATEFGNLLHISLLFYQKELGFFAQLVAFIKAILSIFSKSSDIRKVEYKEAFTRLLFMSIHVAAENLGVDPIKSDFDDRKGRKDASGLGGLIGKLTGN